MTDAAATATARNDAWHATPHDLTFTLLVRLPDGMPHPARPWRTWPRPQEQPEPGSSGAVGALVANKRYPGGRAYFAPQVASVLFPAAPATRSQAPTGGRWIRDPVSVSLEIGGDVDLPEVVLAGRQPPYEKGDELLLYNVPSRSFPARARVTAEGEDNPRLVNREGGPGEGKRWPYATRVEVLGAVDLNVSSERRRIADETGVRTDARCGA